MLQVDGPLWVLLLLLGPLAKSHPMDAAGSKSIYWVDSAMNNKIHVFKLALCILGMVRLHKGKYKKFYVQIIQ